MTDTAATWWTDLTGCSATSEKQSVSLCVESAQSGCKLYTYLILTQLMLADVCVSVFFFLWLIANSRKGKLWWD